MSLRRLANWLLTAGAVLGACCLVLVVLGPVVGVRPLLFRSGSMAPTIETGDLALARSVPARDLEVGDVVSVSTGGGARVTHRIVEIQHQGAEAALTLRGDANEAADAEPYQVTEADRVVLVVPWVGHVVAAASGPLGLFVLGMGAAGLLALAVRGPGGGTGEGPGEGPNGPGRRRDRRPTGRRRAARLGVVAGAAMAVAAAGPASAAPTPWTDDVVVSGTTLTATTVPTTTLQCGALGVLSVTFTWTAVSGATSYTLFWNGGASSKVVTAPTTTTTLVTAISNSTAWLVVNRNFGSVTWSSVASNTRSFTVAVVSLCS